MKNVIIFGTNDLASLCHYYINNDKKYKNYCVVGFVVEEKYWKEERFEGKYVYKWEDFQLGKNDSFIAPIADNKLRERIYNEGKAKGYKFISYISSKCTNYAESIGENCFIQEDNTLQPFTKIKDNCVLWAGNHIGHHSVIENNVFVTSHVVISGHCTIKKGAYLGVNSTIRDGVTIGENAVIGMGAVVTKDVPDGETWIGNPAKKK